MNNKIFSFSGGAFDLFENLLQTYKKKVQTCRGREKKTKHQRHT